MSLRVSLLMPVPPKRVQLQMYGAAGRVHGSAAMRY